MLRNCESPTRFDQRLRLGAALRLAEPAQLGADFDVAEHRAPRQQRILLRHVAEPDTFRHGERAGQLRAWGQQAAHAVEECRLAAAARPNQDDDLAGLDGQVHALERDEAAGAKRDRKIPGLDQRRRLRLLGRYRRFDHFAAP